MITMSEKMDGHLQTVGKRVRWPSTDDAARQAGRHVEVACVAEDAWDVRAQWIVTESYGSDPDSIMCGCPLQGHNHAHAQARVGSIEEAWQLWCEAKSALAAGRPVTCLGTTRSI